MSYSPKIEYLTQQFIISEKTLFFTAQSSQICLEWPLSLCFLYTAYRGVTFYRTNSFTLSILIANGVPMFTYSVSMLCLLISSLHLIQADSTQLSIAYSYYRAAFRAEWWVGLACNLCYYNSHWIFAFKYWTLAYKVEQLRRGQDPDSKNLRFTVILISGVILNTVSAILFSLSIDQYNFKGELKRKKTLIITALLFSSSLIASFFVLIDAFRRFRQTKSSEQVINNLTVFTLSLAFLLFAIGVIAVLFIQLKLDHDLAILES